MKFKEYLIELRFNKEEESKIKSSDITKFKSDILSKIKKFGATDLRMTDHFSDRTNRKGSQPPPITIEEITWVIDQWLKENGSLFKDDIDKIKKNISKKRGLNKKEIPNGTLEWVASGSIKDRSKVHIVMALGQKGIMSGRGEKGTAVLSLPSIIRTKNKKITRGEYYKVNGEYIYKGGV